MADEKKSELKSNESHSDQKLSFDFLNLTEKLLHGIYSFGFEKPSKLQHETIKAIIHNKQDVIVEGIDGMGKTGAFCISALQMVDTQQKQCQIVIISPTKALLSHIKYHLVKLGGKMNNMTCELVTTALLKTRSSQIKAKNENDYDDTRDARLQLQVGSKCQIFSADHDQWLDGSVHKIVNNAEGEWLYIKYASGEWLYIKPVQRLSTIIRAYRYLSDTQIIVGTPTAIQLLISNNILTLKTLKMIVIDEASKYQFKQGYGKNIKQCFLQLNDKGHQENVVDEKKNDDLLKAETYCRIVLFTPELTDEIKTFSESIMINPVYVSEKPDSPLINIEHVDRFVAEKWKLIAFTKLDLGGNVTIIYCNGKAKVIELTQKLRSNDYPVECVHGYMSDDQIFETLGAFRNSKIRHLVATDSFAKGIDVQQIGTVINYDIPNRDEYIYRVTRCGLFGRRCKVITFIDPTNDEQYRKLVDIRTMRTPNHHKQRKILFVDNYNSCQVAVEKLLSNNGDVVGFDCEFGNNGEICLIQIADDKLVIFIRTNGFACYPKNLFDLFANKNIIKCGVGIKNDLAKMKNERQLWDMTVDGIKELNDMYQGENYRWMIKLSDMAIHVLSEKMLWKNRKPGAWQNNVLSFNQIHYAADDAVVAFEIYQQLIKK